MTELFAHMLQVVVPTPAQTSVGSATSRVCGTGCVQRFCVLRQRPACSIQLISQHCLRLTLGQHRALRILLALDVLGKPALLIVREALEVAALCDMFSALTL